MPHGLHRKLSYSDLPEGPNDGKRYELIRGRMFVNPSPNLKHQIVSARLERALAGYFVSRGWEVVHAPTDVILTNHDVFVPDIVVFDLGAETSHRGIQHPPLLVVEILSPSTRRVDRGLKHNRYAELGVSHYWIVDADKKQVECFKLEGGAYALVVSAGGDDAIRHSDFVGLSLELAAVWDQSSAS